ncbi:hypothetical protein QQS21_010852 [Conoideocrella luteorostrata]|uniref:HNH nuclease domain-containing protein n=1 Tax=Conoideocrella luteorostrata TaxID=1105319 RepID=A0AAJ0CE69_9HYPO|nr:hypothetical protein QQS21_010852 [Conoideocrella luteorostrata]
MASAHHRHQNSLEGILDFSSSPTLREDERALAESKFRQIIEHYGADESAPPNTEYNRIELVRSTYDFARSGESKDNVLQAFFSAIGLPMNEPGPVDLSIKETEDNILAKLAGFADYLMDNFFLPLKASTRKTPQPSPAYHSATQSTRAGRQAVIGTTARLKTLRGDCLQRDRHRCVISRSFDQSEAVKRWNTSRADAVDDDGQSLHDGIIEPLEVAHILPHSLVKANDDLELNDTREAALNILNMFDNGVIHLIEGPDIDRPHNALTLTHKLHLFFGDFQIYFKPVPGEPNTYRIDTFLPGSFVDNLLPVTRTLSLTESRVIEPPMPRLLAIHCAVAHILHLSAAGPYIDRILEDAVDQDVRADGSFPLGQLIQLKMEGLMGGIGA